MCGVAGRTGPWALYFSSDSKCQAAFTSFCQCLLNMPAISWHLLAFALPVRGANVNGGLPHSNSNSNSALTYAPHFGCIHQNVAQQRSCAVYFIKFIKISKNNTVLDLASGKACCSQQFSSALYTLYTIIVVEMCVTWRGS